MWLSQGQSRPARDGGTAQVGRVTLPGDPAGVYLAGERRELPVFGPGGYCWRPAAGEQVLVIKTGGDGELPCVAGARTEEKGGLEPGEVCIRAADGLASIRLEQGGIIRMSGYVYVNGALVGEPPEKEEKGLMELMVRDGDYLPDGKGGFRRAEDREELLQRVLWKLSVRRGSFPFLPELGSRLHLLSREKASARAALARQYAAEALADETNLKVTGAELLEDGKLRVEVERQGETMEVTAAL